MLALDIETDGLSFIDDNIVAIGLMTENSDEPNIYTPEDWEESDDFIILLQEYFDQDEILVHNAVFDIPFLCKYFGLPTPLRVWDTLVSERLLTAGLELSVSLAEVSYRRLGIELDKSQQTSFRLGQELTPEQIQYLKEDVKNLFDIQSQQEQEIDFDGIYDVWDVEYSVTPVFCNMVTKGIPVNKNKLQEFIDQVNGDKEQLAIKLWEYLTPHVMDERIAKYDEQKAKLDRYLEKAEAAEKEFENHWWVNLEDYHALTKRLANGESISGGSLEFVRWFEDNDYVSPEKGMKKYVKSEMKEWRKTYKRPPKPKMDDSFINLDSPAQVKAALQSMGVRVENTSRTAIKSLLPNLKGEKQAVVSDLLEYKKLSKLSNAFGDKLMAYLDEDGVLHGIFNQYGTDTGRPTCKEPNLLQIPSSDEFRRLFYGGDKYSLVFADYAQMELRLVAELSHDAVMQQAFTENLDLHRYTASLMYNTPYDEVTDRERKIAKNINFMVLYGGGHNKLRSMLAPEGVFMEEEQAKAAMETWRKTYWRAAYAIKQWGEQALRYGETRTAFGRPRRFNLKNIQNKGDAFRIQRQGANHVIQGSNADITKMAMVLVHEQLEHGYIALQIYDEIVLMVEKGYEAKAMAVLYHSMVSAAEEVLRMTPVGVECYWSPTWSDKDAVATYDGETIKRHVA